jgi:regulatory protein
VITAITSLPDPEASAYKISFSDGSVCSIRTSYLPPEYQKLPREKDEEEDEQEKEEKIRFAGECFEAELAALRLIARAEQTGRGLTAKLERRGHNPEAARQAVSRLSALGTVSDRRYAEVWLEDRVSRKAESPRRLLAALRGRGIDRKTAESALKSALTLEAEARLLQGYMEHIALEGPALKRTLKQEGFSSGAIQAVFED